jgi:hypothetical protein
MDLPGGGRDVQYLEVTVLEDGTYRATSARTIGVMDARHLLDRKSLPAARDVTPVEALLVAEEEDRTPAGIGAERGQERGRRAGHRCPAAVDDLGEGGPAHHPGDAGRRRAVQQPAAADPVAPARAQGYFTLQP